MRNLFFISLFSGIICACQNNSPLIEARVTRVTPQYDSKHYDLPTIRFSILIKNLGNREDTIHVEAFGRRSAPKSGSWWVYYNNKIDSLQLFSASCKNCYEKTTLKPGDSTSLILQINYINVARKINGFHSAESIENELKKVLEQWNTIKYLDNKNNQLFDAGNAPENLMYN
jgi:hypothetical protein